MIQTIKRRLPAMKIDQSITPYKLPSDVAEIIKTLRITPHGVTKVSSFEAHLGRKPKTPLSNITANSSPNNLNWESAKHACLDRKNITKPPLPATQTDNNTETDTTLVEKERWVSHVDPSVCLQKKQHPTWSARR